MGVEPDPDPPLAAGTVVGGRYRIARVLGEGGMGRVYEAQHVYLARRVAVKVLRRDRETQSDALARFEQEAYAASKIGHPAIVEVADFAVLEDGQVYLVMEYLEGETLEAWMNRGGSLLEGLRYLGDAARGLAAAHDAGVVHRDIKPGNIFLARHEGRVQVKLLDFGIAKLVADRESRVETRAGNILGTPYYLAPERALGRALDPRADLYSLGVVLYELLVGTVPFLDPTFAGVLAKQIREQPLDPRQAAPQRAIPDGVASLTMALLAKDPQSRPPSGQALADALDDVIAREGSALADLRVAMVAAPSTDEQTQILEDDGGSTAQVQLTTWQDPGPVPDEPPRAEPSRTEPAHTEPAVVTQTLDTGAGRSGGARAVWLPAVAFVVAAGLGVAAWMGRDAGNGAPSTGADAGRSEAVPPVPAVEGDPSTPGATQPSESPPAPALEPVRAAGAPAAEPAVEPVPPPSAPPSGEADEPHGRGKKTRRAKRSKRRAAEPPPPNTPKKRSTPHKGATPTVPALKDDIYEN